tara:strand:- start:219 stop:1130 length:912 start_codon:yes stop_codon:yes gene_type:complete
MLSRSAKHLYWLSRYVERTENIARMIDVNLELILDFPDDHSLNWKPLIDTLDINDLFESKYKNYNETNVLNFLFEDKKNSSSLKNCLVMSKYNIETIKDDLPKSANISLNHLYEHIIDNKISKVHKRKKLQYITNIVSMTQNFFGSINDNLSRGYEFEFIRLGRFVERTDMISRIIDCLCVSKSSKQTHDFSTMEWISMLTTLSAQDAFRKEAKGEANRGEVITFLLKNDSFPRSVFRSLITIELCLQNLPRNKKLLQMISRLISSSERSKLYNFDDKRLHLYLDNLQKNVSSIDSKIHNIYF